jgi:RecB family exonuclease
VSTEGRITATVSLPDGQQVSLIGYVDRLELDEDGDVVVVDLKTGKYAPTDTSLPDNPQLGLYQLAVDHGAADEAVGRAVRSGGAELVQLRLGADLPKVQPQAPQTPDADGVTLIEHQLMAAVAAVRAEEFVARPGPQCERCEFHAICPAQSSGSVLS